MSIIDTANSLQIPFTVDSKKLKYEPRTIYDGFPSTLGFGVGGKSYSNFLASTVSFLECSSFW